MIKLAIFDLDGVITSTSHEHYQAWKILFHEKFDVLLDDAYEIYTKGVSRMDSLNVLLKCVNIELSESLKTAYAQEKNEIYLKLIQTFSARNLLPGVDRVIARFKALGIYVALASASKNGPLLLHKLGIESWFDYVVDPSKFPSKPAPDIFLDAMHHFGLSNTDCIAFEDAVSGIASIKAAKMFAVGVGHDLSESDVQISSFSDLTEVLWERILMPYAHFEK